MFLGEFDHTLDDRGRIAIPAKFRPELNPGLVVTRGLDRCLLIWPLPEWHAISTKLTALPLMHADARRMQRLLFAGAADMVPDRLGRILVPAFLREYAGLEGPVVIVGLLNRLEVWSQATWAAERSLAEQNSAQLAEHLFALGV